MKPLIVLCALGLVLMPAVEAQTVANRAQALAARGDADRHMGRLDKAKADYERALALAPRNAGTYVGRGRLFLRQGRVVLALADIRHALAIAPRDADAHYGLAEVYDAQNERAKAAAEFQMAIDDYLPSASKTDIADAYVNLGIECAWEQTPDYGRIVAAFTQALAFYPNASPHRIRAYFARSAAYVFQGDYDHAIVDLTAVTALDPKYVKAYQARAYAYDKKGNTQAAAADRKKLKELAGTPT